jgi:hypothetical protein
MAASTPYLVLLLCFASLLQVSLTVANPLQRLLWQLLESESRTRFSRWMTKYSKTYQSEEEKEKRFEVFWDNLNQTGAFHGTKQNSCCK